VSDPLRLLVIGGGPAGLSAVRAFREAGGEGGVAIVGDEERMPYRRPPLTKELLRGEIEAGELPLEEERWLADHGVGLIGGRAVALDPAAKTVTLSGGRELAYETCLLATGAEPRRLPVPGADDPGVRTLRTFDHLRELLARLDDGAPVVVIGSGFIGCEIAASLRMRGHAVTLVSDEPAPNAARLGEEAAARLRGWLEDEGVALRLDRAVERIAREGDELEVVADGARERAPVVVMAAGVAPRGELAGQAGLELDQGAIPAGADMRTAADGVLAAGDVARAQNAAAGRPLRVEHWGEALAQGAIAGRNAAGAEAAWDEVPGFWSVIGSRTLKYAAWGDGWDDVRVEDHGDGAFTAWYGLEGRLVGVLAHERDDDYERGGSLVAEGAPWR
jgi:NADPH-dependent 2,4-dienoyl-CoA reductase/sulfur reductase-like enzyme